MIELNQVELQNLKQLIEMHENLYQKLNNYSLQTLDPQVKQIFIKAAQENLNCKQKLITFLNG